MVNPGCTRVELELLPVHHIGLIAVNGELVGFETKPLFYIKVLAHSTGGLLWKKVNAGMGTIEGACNGL